MADIAELGYRIDSSQIERADRSLDGMSGSAQRAAGSMGGMERSVLRAATRLAAMVVSVQALRGGIGTLAAYGQEMSTVRAITQATAGEFEALSAEARRLGATTRFSASEAAQGMAFLARAGFDANQALAATESTLTLAQAGALGLGQAADIASNVLTGFRLEIGEMNRVVDVLAFTANNANTNVGQLGEAMSMVAPVAAGLRVSVEETAGAIAALSDAGIQGTRAGTGLRRVLSTLESPTAQAAAILADLGLTTDQVRVSQVGLTNAMQALASAGIDTGTALQLFGDRGGPAFEVLSSSIPRVQEMTRSLADAGGTAARIAGVMDDNLNGALLAVRSASEEVVLAFGDLSGTGLESAARGIADALRFVAANADTVSTAAMAGAAGFAAYRASLLLTSAGFAQFTLALGGMTTAMGRALVATRALAAAKALLLGPLGVAILVASSAGLALGAMGRSQEQQAARARNAAEAQGAHNLAMERADRIMEEFAFIQRASNEEARDGVAARQGLRDAMIAYQDSLDGVTAAARANREAEVAAARERADQAAADLQTAQDRLALLRQIQAFAPRAETREEIQALETNIIDLSQAAETALGVLRQIAGLPVASFDPVSEAAARRLTEAERALERQLGLVSMRSDLERAVASALYDAGLSMEALNDESHAANEQARNIARLATQIFGITQSRAEQEERIRDAQAMAARQQQSITDARERLALLGIEDETRRNIAEQMLRAGFAMDDESDAAKEMLATLEQIAVIEQDRSKQAELNAALRRQELDDIAAKEAAERAFQELRTSMQLDGGGELAQLQVRQEQELSILSEAFERKIIAEDEYLSRRNALNERYDQERNMMIAASASAGFGSLAEIMRGSLGEQSAAYQAMFALSKGFAIAEALIGMQVAIEKAHRLGFPQNIPLMAQAAAQGARIVQTITSTQLGFRSGGFTGNMPENAVAGVVHGREGVLNASAMRGIGRQALDHMNRHGSLPPANDNRGQGAINVNVGTINAGSDLTREEAINSIRTAAEEAFTSAVQVSSRETKAQIDRMARPSISARRG